MLNRSTYIPPTKSIFYGLPIDESSKELCDRPMGGDICVSTNLYEKYPKKRSCRYRSCIPIGFEDKSNWRKGHILLVWLVDRFFHKLSFLPIEKKMMYFTQSRASNESVRRKGEIFNQFRYEELLKGWIEESSRPFEKFRYSVRLIYKDETEKIPIATLLQLDTGTLNTNLMLLYLMLTI